MKPIREMLVVNRFLIIVVLLGASTAVASPVRITAPQGWVQGTIDQDELGSWKILPSNLGVVGRRWTSGEARLDVVELASRSANRQEGVNMLAGVADGLTKSKPLLGQVISQRRLVDRVDRRIIDLVVQFEGARRHARWILALDARDVLHTVIGTCDTPAAPSRECDAALETLTVRVERRPTAQERSDAFREKYAWLGLPALAGLLLLWFLVRRFSARRAR